MNKLYVIFLFCLASVFADGGEKTNKPVKGFNVFDGSWSLNLPTGETIKKKSYEFLISHRFLPDVDSGSNTLYGLDGGAKIRFSLGYAPTHKLMLAIARSNLDDNLELSIRHKTFSFGKEERPLNLGFRLGYAWNTEVAGLRKSDSLSKQFWAQVILNKRLSDSFGFGFVYSVLDNSDVFSTRKESINTLGAYLKYEFNSSWATLLEWNGRVSGNDNFEDTLSFGVELNTAGHFFKIVASNTVRTNTSQFLRGSTSSIGDNDWHLGFMITRLLN